MLLRYYQTGKHVATAGTTDIVLVFLAPYNHQTVPLPCSTRKKHHLAGHHTKKEKQTKGDLPSVCHKTLTVVMIGWILVAILYFGVFQYWLV